MDVVRKVLAKEGFRGLLAGAQAGVLGAMLSSALYFGAYELAKAGFSTNVSVWVPSAAPAGAALGEAAGKGGAQQKGSAAPPVPRGTAGGKGKGKQSAAAAAAAVAAAAEAAEAAAEAAGGHYTLRPLVRPALVPPLAAFLGNIASSLVLVPKEVLKQRMQAGAAGSTVGVARALIQAEGVRGLYRGYASTILRNSPGNIISFSGYEFLKQLQLEKLPQGSTLPPVANFATGAPWPWVPDSFIPKGAAGRSSSSAFCHAISVVCFVSDEQRRVDSAAAH